MINGIFIKIKIKIRKIIVEMMLMIVIYKIIMVILLLWYKQWKVKFHKNNYMINLNYKIIRNRL